MTHSRLDVSTALVEDLVVANRVLASHGVLDAFGHVSARSDRHPDRYVLAHFSASFEDVASVSSVESSASLAEGSSEVLSSASHGLSLDLDELWLIVLALLVLISGAVLACYALYIAPALFAEILVDGVLVAGLYHRLRARDMQHWLTAAIKRTWLPVMVTAVIFAISGLLMQKIMPEARSIGQVFRQVYSQQEGKKWLTK